MNLNALMVLVSPYIETMEAFNFLIAAGRPQTVEMRKYEDNRLGEPVVEVNKTKKLVSNKRLN